jgi:hypothetical protein
VRDCVKLLLYIPSYICNYIYIFNLVQWYTNSGEKDSRETDHPNTTRVDDRYNPSDELLDVFEDPMKK